MAVRSSQEDFLLRELRKVAEMMARALGFRSKHDLPAARAELDDAYAVLLGPQSPLMKALDVESAVRLLNHSRKVAAMARLTAVEAMLAGDFAKESERQRLLVRARALAEAAAKLDPTDDEAKAVVAELKGQ